MRSACDLPGIRADAGSDLPGPVPPLSAEPRLAGRGVRLASLIYEGILLVPILFLAGYLFLAVTHDAASIYMRPVFRLWLVLVLGAYFVYCWSRSGQTLALKTWRLRIARADGQPLSVKLALMRYLLALWGALLAGVGFWWAFFDREGQFLHDRLAGTRIVKVGPAAPVTGSQAPEFGAQ